MSSFKTIAVAGGTGGLGQFIVKELVARGVFDVKVLSRKASEVPGAEVKVVDYSSVSSLTDALKGVDVLISTLDGGSTGETQLKLIEATKAAGVKRFYPTEFGTHTLTDSLPFLGGKAAIRKALAEQSDVEWTLVSTGFFTDFGFEPYYVIDREAKTATVVGSGDTIVDYTDRADIAKYVVESLLKPELSRNKHLKIVGDSASFNQIISLLEETTGDKYERKELPVSETEAKVKTEAPGSWPWILVQLQLAQAYGAAHADPNDSGLFPDVKPIKVKDAALFKKAAS